MPPLDGGTTGTRFLKEKNTLWQWQQKAVSKKQDLEPEQEVACLRTIVEHLSDGSFFMKKRNHPVLLHPENQAIQTSQICTENHFLNEYSYCIKKNVQERKPPAISGTPSPVLEASGTNSRSVSAGNEKPCFRTHSFIGMTGLIESFLAFHPYKNTLSFPW